LVATRRLKALTDEVGGHMTLPEGRLTVALSGGADSAALSYLCMASGRQLSAIHVHHGLAASDTMQAAAEAIGSLLDIRVDLARVTLGAGPSPEERAREARYRALHRVEGPVLTAHTRDDNAETILMNLIRGTGPGGLGGIPPLRRPNIHRPLLGAARSELREIAVLAGLPFRDDPMNDDMTLTRNRFRRDVLPVLTAINPRSVEALARAAEIVERDSSFFDRLLPPQGRDDTIAVAVLATLPRPVADRLLIVWLGRRGIGIDSRLMERAWRVVSGLSDSEDLSGGRRLVRRGALLEVS